MCLAIPGKITEINGRRATVEYPGVTREVILGDASFHTGDFVLVQMGIAIQQVSAEAAHTAWRAWQKNPALKSPS